MTERAASSTAVLVCQGRAVADGRYAVGTFSDPVAWHLLDPEERELVEAARRRHAAADGRRRMAYELLWRTGILMVPRTVAIDAAVREHGATQVVVLGAGLDARAWRMPELAGATVVEVDHPASQRDKQRRLGDLTPTARSGRAGARRPRATSASRPRSTGRASTVRSRRPGSGRASSPT